MQHSFKTILIVVYDLLRNSGSFADTEAGQARLGLI